MPRRTVIINSLSKKNGHLMTHGRWLLNNNEAGCGPTGRKLEAWHRTTSPVSTMDERPLPKLKASGTRDIRRVDGPRATLERGDLISQRFAPRI